jgi:hypothetical protein
MTYLIIAKGIKIDSRASGEAIYNFSLFLGLFLPVLPIFTLRGVNVQFYA